MKAVIRTILLLILSLAVWPLQAVAQDIVSYSQVMEDGSLMVSRQKIWLYGVYIPLNDRTCRTYQIPIECGQRALLALEFKIEPYFVSCEKKEEFQDGSISALCRVKGEDLSAWMLQEGWAVALPDAPFEYKVLEKIARHKNRGIWGTITGPP
jgi:endonuclease YncB( thermonuclease family)